MGVNAKAPYGITSHTTQFSISQDALPNKTAVCGSLLAGKNSTNLITHLRTCHKSAYEEFAKQQEHSSAAKKEQGNQAKQGGSTSTGSKHVTSGKYLINFLKGTQRSVWPDDSKEKLLRDEALRTMIVMSPSKACSAYCI